MKKFIITGIIIIFSLSITGQDINQSQAKKAAQFFLQEQSKAFEKHKSTNYTVEAINLVEDNNTKLYYILNMQPRGFVMLTTQKDVWPILGYSFNSKFDINNIPASIKSWMQGYSNQITHFIDNPIQNIAAQNEWNRLINKKSKDCESRIVEPMLYSTWNQGKYYNAACPSDQAGPDGRVLTGCVATALGQLCHYFRHPEQGDSSYSYIDENYGLQSVNFAEQTYNYEEMPNEPTNYHPEIAKLLYHIGVSVDMHYGPSGSGMTNHKAAYSMRTFFGFHDSTQYYFRDSISVDWPGVIIEHLDQQIPMYYAGWGDTNFVSGHAFVCDGYQDSSYFHFNWGWGGSFDGYFYVEDLTPGGSNFTLLHELVVNMVPHSNYPHYISGAREINTYQGTISDGSGPMHDYLNNLDCSWLITPPDTVSAITLTFNQFDLASGDYLKVYEGGDNTGVLLGSYAGSNIPTEIVTDAQQLFVTFESDGSDVGKGFLLGYSSQRASFCNGLSFMTEQTGSFSDGSGTFDYRDNTTCTWNIQVSGMGKYNFDFKNFAIEDENDVLEIRNSAYDLLYSFTGTETPAPFSVVSSNVSIKFITDDSLTSDGWSLNYSAEENTGINEGITNGDVHIYPNPANSKINIELTDIEINGDIIIKIRSMDNKLIYSKLHKNTPSISINIAHLESGIYFVQLMGGNCNFYQKIIIQ